MDEKECFRRLRQRFRGRFAHVHWAAKRLRGESSMGRIAHETIRLVWGEKSMDDHGARRPYMGQNVHGANSYLLSMVRKVYKPMERHIECQRKVVAAKCLYIR